MKKLNITNIDLKSFQVIFLTLLLPALYKIVRINFLSNLPDDSGFNIASQIQWVNPLFEIIEEALILPLFFFIGITTKNCDKTKEKIISSLFLTFLITLFFSIIIRMNIQHLTKFMKQKPELIVQTISYIKLELISIVLFILYKAISVILLQEKKIKLIIYILAIELVLTILCDFFFIGNNFLGYHLGVNGIAYTNIIVKSTLLTIGFYNIFKIYNIKLYKIYKYIKFSSVKKLINVGYISGIESLVRNLMFSLMIIKIINSIGKPGEFWLMMNFIWGWILLPILALGEIIKSESSKNYDIDLKKYFKVTMIIVCLWLLSMPFWSYFLKFIMGLSGETLDSVLHLSYISIVFYIIFAFNNVLDSYFYGTGRTKLMLYQSLIVNIFYYGGIFITIFMLKLFSPTIINITIIFGIGITIDSIFTYLQYLKLTKKSLLIFN